MTSFASMIITTWDQRMLGSPTFLNSRLEDFPPFPLTHPTTAILANISPCDKTDTHTDTQQYKNITFPHTRVVIKID